MPSLPGNRQRPDPVELFGAALVFLPISGTPDHEPSRRRRRRLPDVRKKTDCTDGSKYDVKKARIAPAWKVRSFSRRGQRTVRLHRYSKAMPHSHAAIQVAALIVA